MELLPARYQQWSLEAKHTLSSHLYCKKLFLQLNFSVAYCAFFSDTPNPSIGRPKSELVREDVEYLRSLRFNWSKIASILGVSRATLYRRLDEWQLSRDAYYSTISDSDLDDLVCEIKIRQNPNIGEVMLMAALKVRNVWVHHTRLRARFIVLTHAQRSYAGNIQFEGECTHWMVQTALKAHRW